MSAKAGSYDDVSSIADQTQGEVTFIKSPFLTFLGPHAVVTIVDNRTGVEA